MGYSIENDWLSVDGNDVAFVQSVKAANKNLAVWAGQIVAIKEALVEQPNWVNEAPGAFGFFKDQIGR